MNIKKILKRYYRSFTLRDDKIAIGNISYSQSGEDLIIEYLFRLRNIAVPSYLDIGAYHPIAANNTYKFYLKGARGVNIDANPAALGNFISIRPEDRNLNIGVGIDTGFSNFYIMEDSALNTFSEEEKNSLEKIGHHLKEIKNIQVIPINKILSDYFGYVAPDFISIDAEGVDFDIIKSFDFRKFAPKVICIETINYTPDGTGTKRYDLCHYIENSGYFEYANTNINSIFVNKEWWYNKK